MRDDKMLRYVERRVNRRDGTVRWYWHRRGHKIRRLPDDLAELVALAQQLNAGADATPEEQARRGSISWVIRCYRESDKYADLKPSTLGYYNRYLRQIEALGPALPFSSFTRRVVVDLIESYSKIHQRREAATVLRNLFSIARYHGIVEVDATSGLRLKTTKPRDRIWTDDEIGRWLDAAAGYEPFVTTGFLLLQYTAQRPGDVLRMSWPQYSGTAIRLRQQKTDKLLDVPPHPVLRSHLDGLLRSSTSLTILVHRGRPVTYATFSQRFREICRQIGIDAQARDLRRTAMVNMARAGATTPQIASVSGHSIEATQRILETYLPRNFDLAEAAITRLAEYQKKGS